MIDFSNCKTVPKGWGSEQIIVSNDKYCGKFLVFEPGKQMSLHFHAIKHETWMVLSGNVTITMINGKDARITEYCAKPGDLIVVEPLVPHRIKNDGDSQAIILEISTPDNIDDNYRVSPGDSQQGCA